MNWNNLLKPKKIINAICIEGKAACQIIRHGRPGMVLQFLGGLGDELLLTCLARELRKRDNKISIWQISPAAELLANNPDYTVVLGSSYWSLRHSNVLKLRRPVLGYSEMLAGDDQWQSPAEHVLATLLRQASITGDVALRPYVYLRKKEIESWISGKVQICFQSLGRGTHETWMENKIWPHERFREVVNQIRLRYPSVLTIQLGLDADPPLNCERDLRGKTSLRETASILASSNLFVGTEGLLVHLARAVDTRSVVIFGGRSRAWQLGYSCNINIERFPECSPCWAKHRCEYNRICMADISVADVFNAIEQGISSMSDVLTTDRAFL